MIKPEILAPAGSEEQLTAAIRSRADAVYLGTDCFNARRNADNFTPEKLKQAVSYAHARGVRVYVTMNTLITDSEIPDAVQNIKAIAESGADAVIVQDIAAAKLIKECCPQLRLHASTQMAIHNKMGLRALKELGFKRAVLARELSFDEIKELCASTDMEIEIFVHGALCMSVSGMCYLSSMLGGRSGNRGLCAQPCRLNFNCRGREHALSLKDSSLISHISSLADAGVASFKIEGRMKRPEYAAAAVKACRDALEGREYDENTLKSVFSRSGFTDGYYAGKRTLDMFGYRQKDDVTAATASILKKIASEYKDEPAEIKINASLCADEGSSSFTVSDGINTVTVNGDRPQAAISKPLDRDFALKCFSKTGGTIFSLNKFDADIADGISLSASQMNAMRRNALDELYEKRAEIKPLEFKEPKIGVISSGSGGGDTKLRLHFSSAEQIPESCKDEEIILPMNEILKKPEVISRFGRRLIAEAPALIYPRDEEIFRQRLGRLRELGIKRIYCSNIGIINECIKEGFAVHASSYTNIINSSSAKFYTDAGCRDICVSHEAAMDKIKAMSRGIETGAVTYGFLPLMYFRACPAQTANGCAGCSGFTLIKDRLNTEFHIMCRYKKYSVLLNSVPLYICDKDLSALDFQILYFTFEKKETCEKIINAAKTKAPLPCKKTGGLYYRELL